MAATGVLDEGTIEALQRRIGVPQRRKRRPHHEELTADSFRHYAMAYGDDNPRFCDRAYTRAGLWGDVIAPPFYPLTAGRPVDVEWNDEQRAAMSGGNPLAGVGEYLCGERWLWAAPLLPGTELERIDCIDAAALKRSGFGGGVGVLVSTRSEWRAGSHVACVRLTDMWHAERSGTRRTADRRVVDSTDYTAEQLGELDLLYELEEVRGAETRTWDSVAVGDDLGRIAKGPLTLTDVITYHIGVGWGAYGGGTGKIAYQNRTKIPKLYVPNAHGIPDSVQRCHWDDEWARHLGHPAAYDYGTMRSNWMVHLVTNWMGDDGWLWKLTASVSRFNYLGDAHIMSGTVTAVRPRDDAQGEVDVALEGTNQRGEVTCNGTATVLLPMPGASVSVPSISERDLPPALDPPTDR